MDAPNTTAMIALLPISSDWCKIDLPHLTLVYAGKTDELPSTAFKDLCQDAAAIAQLSRPITLRVTGLDVFGPDGERVNVLKLLLTPELAAMRRSVEKWNRSEYTEYRPHCTVGPVHETAPIVPGMIAFDRILVAYNDEHVPFWFSKR